MPEKPVKKIAGIVGPDMDVANGIDHGTVRTYTIWGDIAYQIGGKMGYDIVRKSDEHHHAGHSSVGEADR